ncbi:MAG TPA: HlyD family secretion protein [Opitutaceae bacterium]|nr:HlyD family secretion protein [Opitutaceae bacterium]
MSSITVTDIQRSTASSSSQATPRRRLSPRSIIGIIILIAVMAWVAKFLYHLFRYEETDDAYVAGHVHQISSQVSGPVKAVLVKDNQAVKAGTVLIQIDPLEFDIGLLRAKASLAQAKAQDLQVLAAASQIAAQLTEAEARVYQAEAQTAQTKAQSDLAQLNHKRNLQLFQDNTGAVTQADVDNTQSALDVAKAADQAAEANLRATKAAVVSALAAQEAAKAQHVGAQASVAAAEAQVSDAERQLSYASIKAPADGHIGNKSVEAGNRVDSGQALFALVEDEVWIVANFKETQLARMKPGMAVDVAIDALPGRIFEGAIDSIAPASGSQFALLPPDNATGNFTKVVQRVPVKIVFSADSIRDVQDRLRPGLSVVVDIKVR